MSITSNNINPSNVDEDAARAIAIDFIRPYVERGDTPLQITEGGMGRSRHDHTIQIGGCCWVFSRRHDFGSWRLVVTSLNDKECIIQFSIDELIKEINTPATQMTLF